MKKNHFPTGKGERMEMHLRAITRTMGTMAIKHFRRSFRNKAFTDQGKEPWKPRQQEGRGSLMSVSGALRRSIHKTGVTTKSVTIVAGGPKVPYAAAHNEGQTLRPRVTKKMRKYAWAKHYEAMEQDDQEKANIWKGLALTKKSRLTIKMPRRQFMGYSHALHKRTRKLIIRDLNSAFYGNSL